MSRIGKRPVPLPDGVKVDISGPVVRVEGPKGKLEMQMVPEVSAKLADDSKSIVVERAADTKRHRTMHGLTRSLINNMVIGVTEGFSKGLEIVGTGYGAKVEGANLVLNVGFCKPVIMPIPDGITVESVNAQEFIVRGIDKQLVGEFAARVRRVRKPEPYKGKGIRYKDEVVRKKAGKAFVGAA